MTLVGFVFTFLLFKDAKLLQTLAGESGLLKLTFTLTVLTMLVQNL